VFRKILARPLGQKGTSTRKRGKKGKSNKADADLAEIKREARPNRIIDGPLTVLLKVRAETATSGRKETDHRNTRKDEVFWGEGKTGERVE